MSESETGPTDDAPSDADEGSAQPDNRSALKPHLARTSLVILLLIAAALLGGWYWYYSQQFVSTENAYLEGTIIRVAAQVPGKIKTVAVAEQEMVEKGDLLVRIVPSDYQVALERARAQHNSAEAQLAQAKSGLAVAQAAVEQAKSKLTVARIKTENAAADLQRLRQVDPRAIPEQKLEDTKDRVEQARALQQAAARRLDAAKARVDAARAAITAAKAAISEAEARIKDAKLQLSYTEIRAPAEGQVAEVAVDPGEYVRPGQVLAAVVPDKVWVKANFKETQITSMEPGDPVKIHIDAYPNRSFHGQVQSIQRATGSQFSLLPPQNATGNFVKVVQRVPVKIVFDEPPDLPVPAPGLSVVPTVRVLDNPPWPWRDDLAQ